METAAKHEKLEPPIVQANGGIPLLYDSLDETNDPNGKKPAPTDSTVSTRKFLSNLPRLQRK